MNKPHAPHWIAGRETQAALGNQSEAERFTHKVYGELVKHFGLGTNHTFSSWQELPEDEREKWVNALSVIHTDLKSDVARGDDSTGGPLQSQPAH